MNMVAEVLRNVVFMLAMLPTEEIEQHVRECRESLRRADSLGPILNPTGWIKAQSSGEMENARHELAIAEGLLAARRALDKREAWVAEVAQKASAHDG